MSLDVKHTVLVTGFGPFNRYVVNASWEAVKELQKLWTNTEEFSDVNLVIEEIPVSYNYVSCRVPQLWKEYNPVIVLHVGVSHKAECLTIERCAHSSDYKMCDINNELPDETDIEFNVLKTGLDIHTLCNSVNQNYEQNGCKACVSHDAGRFLCEYTFYQSLCVQPTKTLFVHVPDFDTYSSTQSAKGLYNILFYLMKNLK